jgi:hypothetical protein
MMYMYSSSSSLFSSGDGISWTNANPSQSYYGGWLQGAAVFSNEIWVLGVRMSQDGYVWPSSLNENITHARSGNGTLWSAATFSSSAGSMLPRKGHTTVVHQGKLWVIGGYVKDSVDIYGSVYSKASAEVWSSGNGSAWNLVDAVAPFGPRALLEAVSFHDKLWIFGGTKDKNNPYNSGTSSGIPTYTDIWYYE